MSRTSNINKSLLFFPAYAATYYYYFLIHTVFKLYNL
jgi:hypothetical protein